MGIKVGIDIDEAAQALNEWMDRQHAEGRSFNHFDLDDEFMRLYPEATIQEGSEVSRRLMELNHIDISPIPPTVH